MMSAIFCSVPTINCTTVGYQVTYSGTVLRIVDTGTMKELQAYPSALCSEAAQTPLSEPNHNCLPITTVAIQKTSQESKPVRLTVRRLWKGRRQMKSHICVALAAICVFVMTAAVAAGEGAITFTPEVLQESGDSVVLAWSDISSPNVDDRIVLYAQKQQNGGDVQLVKIGYIEIAKSSTWNAGKGQTEIRLVNLRVPYVMRYESEKL